MHRFGRAVRGRRRPPDRTREHRHDRPLVRPVPSRNGPPGRGRRGPHPPRRCRRPAGQDLLRRYAAAHRPRREPHRPPPGAVPRRTHRRLLTEGTATELKDRTGGAVVELDLPAQQRQAAMTALEPLAPRHDHDRDRIVLPAPDGALTLRDALRLLDHAELTPTDVALHRPTLHDVFLTLTRHTAPELAGRSA